MTVSGLLSTDQLSYKGAHKKKTKKQAISAREQALCQLCFESRVEVKEEKDTKVMPCKWHSEVKYKVNC